jgi:signal transduction histidine kinase
MQLKSGTPLHREPLNMRELVDEIIETVVHENDVAIRVEVDPQLFVLADMRLLESALSNLVQNAIKFTHDHGEVWIAATETPAGIEVHVEDECGGFGGEDTKPLFDAFVQGDQKSGGVGLGLAITRQAIEAHGGSVTVRDLTPKGCRFSVWLPR